MTYPPYEPPPPTAPPPSGPTYGEPAYQPQYYGPPGYGQSPYGAAPVTPPDDHGNKAILAAIVVAVVLVGVIVVAVALTRSGGNSPSAADAALPSITDIPSSPVGPAQAGSARAGSNDDDPPSPTGTTAPPAGPSVANAQVVALRYFADLNHDDQADARNLLCEAAKAGFDNTVSDPDNDFTFAWSGINYLSVGAVDDDVTVLTYQVTLTKDSQVQDISLLLYFVNEGGVKICGETSA
jgi:hypothetical protein